MSKIVKYRHHGRLVSVDMLLKGKHRYHCLCWKCRKFKPSSRDNNCKIANALYSICCLTGVTTPVFECPDFEMGNAADLKLEAVFVDGDKSVS